MSQETQNLDDKTTPRPFPTTLADLQHHLPSINSRTSTKSIYSTLSALRKSTLSIPNRLASILHDADFVQALHTHLTTHSDAPWPLIPNERSGSWPLNPSLKCSSQNSAEPVSAYFKSTDGHISQWAFSPRRLNLPVLGTLGECGAAVLIDTTRRGKSFPDALRRTVPIWCAVWNTLLFPGFELGFQELDLDGSEVAQIEARIPAFVEDLRGLGLDLGKVKEVVSRPVRCVWVVQPDEKWEWNECFRELESRVEVERRREVNVLVCCSASRRVVGAEMSGDGYIQGAGDDSEGWSRGLSASMFWENREELMRAAKDGEDMEELVTRIVGDTKRRVDGRGAVLIKPAKGLFLGSGVAGEDMGKFDLIVDCNSAEVNEKGRLGLGCRDGKLGSKMLRDKLGIVKAKIQDVFKASLSARISAVCSTGRDLSAGVVLVILCCFFDDQGKFSGQNIRSR